MMMRGRNEESRALLRHALTIARDAGALQAMLRAYFNLYFEPIALVQEYARTGLELARRFGHRQYELMFLGRLASCHWLLGEWAEAEAVAEPFRDPANWEAGSFAISRALPALVHLHVHRGELEEAEGLVRMRESSATSAGVYERADYFTSLAMVARARGDLDTARKAREELVEILAKVGASHETTRESVVESIEVSLDAGEIDLAEELVERYRWTVTVSGYLEPHLVRFEPRIALATGQDDAAVEASFERSLGLLREGDSRFSLAVGLLEYGEWLAGSGRAEEARPFLREAGEIFERLGARPWLERLAAANPSAQVSVPGE